MREVIVAIDPIGCDAYRHIECEEIVRCRDCIYSEVISERYDYLLCGQFGETVP